VKESAFRAAVIRHVPACVHRQPMPAGASGAFPGTPDSYFDYERDLWVEWKVYPEGVLSVNTPLKALPTDKQRMWLDRRYKAGGNACVILGFKVGSRMHGVVLETPSLWHAPAAREWVRAHSLPAADLGAYIFKRVSACASSP
jgi:hypothetical protein